jgi:hypothetical protein
LILKEMKRTINPENNNKRQIIGKYISVPYGYRPSDLVEYHRTSNDNTRNIIESFSGKEILSYDNKEHEPCDNKYHVSCDSKDPPMSDLLIAKLLGDSI